MLRICDGCDGGIYDEMEGTTSQFKGQCACHVLSLCLAVTMICMFPSGWCCCLFSMGMHIGCLIVCGIGALFALVAGALCADEANKANQVGLPAEAAEVSAAMILVGFVWAALATTCAGIALGLGMKDGKRSSR